MPKSQTEKVSILLIDRAEATVLEVFGKICGDVAIRDISLQGGQERDRMAGIISFVGDLMWTLALILPSDSAESIARQFAGFDIPFRDDNMGDIVGELVNVLGGGICGNLEKCGVRTQMSMPTIARGEAFELMQSSRFPKHRMYCTAAGSDFWVEITTIAGADGS